VAVRVIVRELCAALLFELVDGALSGNSAGGRWVGEVTLPPDDASFHARSTYSGCVLIVRNEVRRAVLLDHRTPPVWRPPPRGPRDDQHPYFD
jgi:hypothetical protein